MVVMDLDLPEPADVLGVEIFWKIVHEALINNITFIISAGKDEWLYRRLPGVLTVANNTSATTKIIHQKETPEIFCDGNNVTTPVFASENQDQKLPASSAATAIVVGVVSLIISTWRLTQSSDDDDRAEIIPFELVNRIMRQEMDGGKSLQPWKFFGKRPTDAKEGSW
jgi:hypothetical protein